MYIYVLYMYMAGRFHCELIFANFTTCSQYASELYLLSEKLNIYLGWAW